MPITKQVIKRMKQSRVRYARNRHYSSRMKSMIKLILDYIKKGDTDNAAKIMPKVVSSIDIAAKKKLIHKNNAAHKKSRVERALSGAGTAKPKVEKEVKKAAPKKDIPLDNTSQTDEVKKDSTKSATEKKAEEKKEDK